jgi:L-rhamnose-H+ transport protein
MVVSDRRQFPRKQFKNCTTALEKRQSKMRSNQNLLLPMLLVAVGGVLAGVFAFPMKRLREWNWENIWFAYSCFGFLLIPFLVVHSTVPNLLGVYQSVPSSCLIAVIAGGYAWGWGSALFGVGIQRLGMGLGFSLIMGITTVLGALAPLLIMGTGSIHLSWLVSGLLLLTVGLALCGRAGALRQHVGNDAPSSRDYQIGLVLCILAGCFSAAFNYGAAAARPIQDAAVAQGATGWAAANTFWPIMLLGGFLGNATYCSILFNRNGSISKFWSTGVRGWCICLAMGSIWMAGVLLYGLGSFLIGPLGTVLGWPAFTAFMVLSAYFLGLLTGEWRGASRRCLLWMNAGVLLITAALFLVAQGR